MSDLAREFTLYFLTVMSCGAGYAAFSVYLGDCLRATQPRSGALESLIWFTVWMSIGLAIVFGPAMAAVFFRQWWRGVEE